MKLRVNPGPHRHAWDWKAALAALQRFILGDPEAIVVLDETAELKKGTKTVGVAWQHAGITGQVENCQTVVFLAYVTARAHALFDFRLYLPKAWCADRERRERARVQEDVPFTTKPALGTAMVAARPAPGVPFAWVAGDEVYGRSSKLREACEKDRKGYVFAVPVNFTVTLPSGRKTTVAAVARLIPQMAWETRSCGRGCKGHRDYAWAWAATSSPRHWILIRRSLSDPADLAFYYCHAPERPASIPARPRSQKRPSLVFPQTWVKPRKSNVSGFARPRFRRLGAAKRPNSMRRVLSGCSSRLNFANRSRRSLRNRFASLRCWNPTTKSSANLTMITSPCA